MAPYDGPQSTPSASAADYHATGKTLDFVVDVTASVQDLILDDGSRVDLWDGTLLFTFEEQQSSVTLTFRPSNSSYALDGTCTIDSGGSIQVIHQGNDVQVIIPRDQEGYVLEMFHVAPRTSAARGSGDGIGHLSLVKSKLVLSTQESPANPELSPVVTA